jgi:hypothetical protein
LTIRITLLSRSTKLLWVPNTFAKTLGSLPRKRHFISHAEFYLHTRGCTDFTDPSSECITDQ